METVQAKVPELRSKFLEKAEEDFHPKDIARATEDDHWLKRFLLHHDGDVDDALNMMMETCEWRKINKVNDINEATINMNYLKDGSLFVHNRDKDGKSLFIFKCSKHVKGQKDAEELKKIVIYWFERVERQDKGEQITIFFDMTETGLSNMDLDYTKYLITLCKLYYPYMLNYILIFEMPFILNAAFKVIKSWLPAKAVQKIKFVHKSNLHEYVDSSQALKNWGGTDPYVFTFEPEQTNNNVEWGKTDENKKKVHFAENTPLGIGNASGDDSRVTVKPADAIIFTEDGQEMSGSLSIKNVSETAITYKVKTTAPEKFRVRPSMGTLGIGGRVTININALAGVSYPSIVKDKFLVLTLPIGSEDQQNTPEVWKSPESKKLMKEYKVRCRINSPVLASSQSSTVQHANGGLGSSHFQTSNVEQKMSQLLVTANHLNERFTELEGSLRTLKILNLVIIGFAVFFLAAFYKNRSDNDDTCSVHENSL